MKEDRNHQNSLRQNKKSSTAIYTISIGTVVIFLVYFALKQLFHFDLVDLIYNLFMLKYLPAIGSDVGYGLLFVIGILTSFHCIGMCGGIAMSQTIRCGEQQISNTKHGGWLGPTTLYNLGRVFSYTLVGGVVGGLGRVLSFNGIFRGIIPILGGIFMIIMGINLIGVLPVLRKLNLTLPSFAARRIMGKKNHTPLLVGMLTGLMPCGPLQIVQLYALGTKSIAVGALSMLVFSLGTLPALFIFGAINSFISKKYSKKILKLCAAFVVVLGFVMISRGLALSGINLHLFHQEEVSADGISKIQGSIQLVTTELKSGSYTPITVQKGVPLKWTIIADKETLNECNNAITIPKLNLNKKLVAGENVIEFTPETEGKLIYTCWMGMIKSSITVVSDLTAISVGNTALTANDQVKQVKNETKCNMGDLSSDSTGNNKMSGCGADNNIDQLQERKIENNEKKKSEIATGVKKEDPSKADIQTWEGYLIDKHCFEIMKPEKETRACLLMEECESSGYGIAVKQSDESYKYFLFDKKGHCLAFDYLNKATKNTGFKLAVKGCLDGKVISVVELNSH